MSGLIIEGICATGKSIIYKTISTKEPYLERQTRIQLSEYLTERIIENVNPSISQRVQLLKGYVNMLDMIYSNFYTSRFKNTKSSRVKPCFLLERFHLTHAVESKSFEPFRDIDIKLKNMGFKLIVLKMEEKVIKDRITDTFSRRPKTWYNYVMSFGGIEKAAKRYSLMQDRLLEYTKLTSLSLKVIDTTDMEWDRYVKEAEEFWGLR